MFGATRALAVLNLSLLLELSLRLPVSNGASWIPVSLFTIKSFRRVKSSAQSNQQPRPQRPAGFLPNESFVSRQHADSLEDITTDPSLQQNSLLERRAWLKACTVSSARFLATTTVGFGTANLLVESSHVSTAALALETTETTGLSVSSPANVRRKLSATKELCDPTVSVWQTSGSGRASQRTVVLLGTAHISQASAELAGTLVRDIRPDAVFVELDIKRVTGLGRSSPSSGTAADDSNVGPGTAALSPSVQVVIPKIPPSQYLVASSSKLLTMGETTTESMATDSSLGLSPSSSLGPRPLPTSQPTTGNWFSRGAMNLASAAVGNAVKGMYSNLSNSGFSPGEEFATSIRAGQEVGAAIVLGDQDVQVTLRRLTQALAATDLNQLLSPNSALEQSMNELLPAPPASVSTDSALFKEELTAYVEQMKSRESVRKLMKELNEIAPALVQVMLTERDAYMAAGLDTLNEFNCIVAVMGIAHQDGVERNLRERGWTALPLQCSQDQLIQ